MSADPDRCPLFVELCAGTAALSLRLHHPRARPPVSRMGAKTGYANVILRCMGLRPGQGSADGTRYLWCEPDKGVRLLLHAMTSREIATKAAAIIASWKDEDPKALWLRLRAEGPAVCPPVDAREVAREVLSVKWSFSQRGPAHGYGGPGTNPGMMANRDEAIGCNSTARLITDAPTLPATITADARDIDPREVARAARLLTANRLINLDPETWRNTGEGGTTHGGAEFCTPAPALADAVEGVPEVPGAVVDDARAVDPREVARWSLVSGWAAHGKAAGSYGGPGRCGDKTCALTIEGAERRYRDAPTLSATLTDDARAVDPPQLPPGVVVYIDPPYENCTGYAHALPRSEWLLIVRRWAEAGALVVVSEAEPIPELVAEGWHAVEITGERKGQKRTFSKQQREWLTMSRPPAWRPSEQMGLFNGG